MVEGRKGGGEGPRILTNLSFLNKNDEQQVFKNVKSGRAFELYNLYNSIIIKIKYSTFINMYYNFNVVGKDVFITYSRLRISDQGEKFNDRCLLMFNCYCFSLFTFSRVCRRVRHLNSTQKAILLITMWHTNRGGWPVGERVPEIF